MNDARTPSHPVMAEPYPLQRRFQRIILPALATLLVASVLLSTYGAKRLVESLYLELAQQRALSIAKSAARQVPHAWDLLSSITSADALPPRAAMEELNRSLQSIMADSRLDKLKIYDDGGRLIFNSDGAGLGEVERGPAMTELMKELEPQIVLTHEPLGALYELYVWLPDDRGRPRLIFELYEPVDYLDRLIFANLARQVGVPVVLLLALTLVLWRLVQHAQSDIDRRTMALADVRDRLAKLVSSQAVGAVNRASRQGAVESTSLDATLYYADVRAFTSFAEESPPQIVVDFLNRILSVQVRLLREHGGDVDKIIGDAVLAVFEGPDRAARALTCAAAVQEALCGETDLPRGLGIGLHDGHVISGIVGPEERQDFTVIGDAVNVAARLCSLADVGEIVVDTRTLARAGHPSGFGPVEDVQVKGRMETLRVRRRIVRAEP